jgi:hypothetical protein
MKTLLRILLDIALFPVILMIAVAQATMDIWFYVRGQEPPNI